MTSVTEFILTPEMVKATFIYCPICGHEYRANGMGPQNNKKLTWLLQHALFLTTRKMRLPAKAHDITYLIVPYMKVTYIDGDYVKVCETRKDCDDLFLDLMLARANDSYPWMKDYYKNGAEIAYDIVREDGAESFQHVH